MTNRNKVFIATSLDGFIADKQGKVDWLDAIPNAENDDMGYNAFISTVDAIVMGKNTFETVLGFGIDWPYKIPVFVLSRSLKEVPKNLVGKATLVRGAPKEIVQQLNQRHFHQLYIDGGKTIQNFLNEDLIDEMTITIIPTLLGDGIPLFSGGTKKLNFICESTRIYLNQIVQNKFVRVQR